MPNDKSDLIRLLEAELEVIEAGGYAPPAGKPGEGKRMFDRSVVCINHWQVPDHDSECHDNCVLLDAVPEGHRGDSMPCHHIPLNASGDTVASLERAGDREALEERVKSWLRNRIRQLREESGSESGQSSTAY